MSKRDHRRVAARAAGERFYEGRPCIHCRATLRYVSGGTCVACMRGHSNANNKALGGSPGCGYVIPAERPSQQLLAERDRAFSVAPTIEQRLLGDPLPGRSALDQKRASP